MRRCYPGIYDKQWRAPFGDHQVDLRLQPEPGQIALLIERHGNGRRM